MRNMICFLDAFFYRKEIQKGESKEREGFTHITMLNKTKKCIC